MAIVSPPQRPTSEEILDMKLVEKKRNKTNHHFVTTATYDSFSAFPATFKQSVTGPAR